MADITKCNSEECPLRQSCYRYTAPKSNYQSVFVIPPYNKETKSCDEFWQIKNKTNETR